MAKAKLEPRRLVRVREVDEGSAVFPEMPMSATEAEVEESERRQVSKFPELNGKTLVGHGTPAPDEPPSSDEPVSLAARTPGVAVIVKPREHRSRRESSTADKLSSAVYARLELPAEEAQPTFAIRTHEVAIERVAVKPKRKAAGGETWSVAPAMSARTMIKAALGGVVLVSLCLALVLALNVWRRNSGASSALDYRGLEMDPKADPLDARFTMFMESPAGIQNEAIQVLAGYGAARTPEDAVPWLRAGDAAELRRCQWQPWTSRPRVDQPEMLQFAFMDGFEPPFMVAWGIREDFSPFCAYFVRQSGKLRLDWEATEGRCDVPIAMLPEATDVKQALVRCELEIRAFHTRAFPEERYRSYVLNSANHLDWVWGYTTRDSKDDQTLRELLNDTSTILEPKQRERVTLRVTAPAERDQPNQFLITDVLHNEWLAP